jgi:hypothetical protein
MQDFMLSVFFSIQGIGAASGLVFHEQVLWLISDNSNRLYAYDTSEKKLSEFALPGAEGNQNIPKKLKPDFEAIALHDDKLYLFGSGSTPNRNKMFVTDLKPGIAFEEKDLSDLYEKMQKQSNLGIDDFNIEGVINNGPQWFFFQRGNGPAGKNGIFTVNGNLLGDDFAISYKDLTLPEIGGIPATFTDAAMVDGQIWFLATAEKSNSVYEDGEILGSMVGQIHLEKLEMTSSTVISTTHKFEGITLYRKEKNTITFLLCEDNDQEASESGIYKLSLPL